MSPMLFLFNLVGHLFLIMISRDILRYFLANTMCQTSQYLYYIILKQYYVQQLIDLMHNGVLQSWSPYAEHYLIKLMLIVKTSGGMKGGPYISFQNSTFSYVVLPHAKVGLNLFGH